MVISGAGFCESRTLLRFPIFPANGRTLSRAEKRKKHFEDRARLREEDRARLRERSLPSDRCPGTVAQRSLLSDHCPATVARSSSVSPARRRTAGTAHEVPSCAAPPGRLPARSGKSRFPSNRLLQASCQKTSPAPGGWTPNCDSSLRFSFFLRFGSALRIPKRRQKG
jgi:hypothetical protein